MKQTEAVVVPAIHGDSSVTCIRRLGRFGVRTIAISDRDTAPSFRSRYCDERVLAPSPEEDPLEYKDALLTLARRPAVRTIVPMREEDVYLLAKYRSEFDEHVATLWPSMETLKDAHDRVRLAEAAREAGVAVPETTPLNEVDDWNRPLIVKPRYPILTDEYVDSLSPGELVVPPSTKYLDPDSEPDVEALVSEMDHVPIVQPYIAGTEYSYWALYDGGEPVAMGQRRQLRAWTYAGGESTYRETTDIPRLAEVGAALLDHLDWHGLGFPQFVRDAETGEFQLLELNPRMWRASLLCAVAAGGDFPQYYYRVARGDSLRLGDVCDPGVGSHNLVGEISYLNSIRRSDVSAPYVERPAFGPSAAEVLSSLIAQPRFDYFDRSDPRPFARYLYDAVRGKMGMT